MDLTMFYVTVFVVVITLFFPEIKAALTEIDSERYVEVDQISTQKITGWDDQKVKQGYPNSSWSEVPDSPFYFLNTTDLSFATKSKPFPVRAKTFIAIKTDGGEASSVTFTELIDCKNGKSQPISKLFAANDTLFEESHNPTVIHTETVNGEWRPFNEKNKVFSEICKPLNK